MFNLCTKCIGSDDLRMIKLPQDQCKLCSRPFETYQWQWKGSHKTVICLTCSTVRNCCQGCMLDLNFLIPLDIRDTALKMSGLEHLVPQISNTRNSDVRAAIADKQDGKVSLMTSEKAKEVLEKIAAGLSQPKITAKTPKSTVSPELSKIIKKLPFNGSLSPPTSDITSFFIFGIDPGLPQYLISDYALKFGKLKTINVVHSGKFGFVEFTKRSSAEAFAKSISTKKGPGLLVLERYAVRVVWSEVMALPPNEYKKISLVVDKVMVQLAKKR